MREQRAAEMGTTVLNYSVSAYKEGAFGPRDRTIKDPLMSVGAKRWNYLSIVHGQQGAEYTIST
jgi:hypothetical protein